MSDTDVQRTPESDQERPQPSGPPPSGPNPFLKVVEQPRIVLLLLIAWSAMTVLTEAANQSGIFMDIRTDEIDGALGGLGLAWQGVPMALLYADSFRDPTAHRRIFWLALVHMGAAILANFYHLGKGDFSFESIIIPVATAGVLFFLSFVQLFQATGPDESKGNGAEAKAT